MAEKFNLKSKYFNYHSTPREQNLVNNLIKECIHIHGIDMIYIPRKYVNLDTLYGEAPLSSFEKTFDMVFHVESADAYEGNHNFLDGLGLDIQDQVKLIVSRDVFKSVVVDSVENEDDIQKPRAGDLIYFQITNRLFEIVNVEDYQLFYQLGKQYTYALTIEFFDYNHEKINTGLDEIDTKNLDLVNTALEITLENANNGDYTQDEIVFVGADLLSATFTGRVVSWDTLTKKLVTKDNFGTLDQGLTVVGETSTTSYETLSYIKIKNNSADEKTRDNEIIQGQANTIFESDDDFGYGDF